MTELQRENGRLTINKLMMHTGLTDEQVNQKIAETDLSKIADLFDSIYDLRDQFGLSNAEKADVERLQHISTKRSVKKALKSWRNRYPYKATFKNLLIILLNNVKGGVAKDVANYVSNRPQQEPTNEQLIDHTGLADKEVNQDMAEKNVHKKGVVAKDVADYISKRHQQEPTNNQPRPEERKKGLVCTFVLVLLAVGVVLLSMALYSQDHDGLPILTMTDFKKYKANKSVWDSPPVYTHHQGYKIYLIVEPNGFDTGKGTHVSVFVHLMKGEFDDSLKWPFRGTISVRLIDQLHGVDHREYTFTYDDRMFKWVDGKVTEGDRVELGWGNPQFIEYSKLEPNYLLDNTLLFQIHKYSIL